MKHSEKPAGMTLAEALGIQVPDNAPGGSPLAYMAREGTQRTTRGHAAATESAYSGFGDYDSLNTQWGGEGL